MVDSTAKGHIIFLAKKQQRNAQTNLNAIAVHILKTRDVDFLARMIEKYGSELLQELNGLPKEDKAEDNCQQEQQQNTLGND